MHHFSKSVTVVEYEKLGILASVIKNAPFIITKSEDKRKHFSCFTLQRRLKKLFNDSLSAIVSLVDWVAEAERRLGSEQPQSEAAKPLMQQLDDHQVCRSISCLGWENGFIGCVGTYNYSKCKIVIIFFFSNCIFMLCERCIQMSKIKPVIGSVVFEMVSGVLHKEAKLIQCL